MKSDLDDWGVLMFCMPGLVLRLAPYKHNLVILWVWCKRPSKPLISLMCFLWFCSSLYYSWSDFWHCYKGTHRSMIWFGLDVPVTVLKHCALSPGLHGVWTWWNSIIFYIALKCSCVLNFSLQYLAIFLAALIKKKRKEKKSQTQSQPDTANKQNRDGCLLYVLTDFIGFEKCL